MVARGESPAFIATPTMPAELTYARLRVLKAIEQTGFPPSSTRADMLRRMQEAGLICPIGGSKPWLITKHGAKAMREADAKESRRLLAAACNRIRA